MAIWELGSIGSWQQGQGRRNSALFWRREKAFLSMCSLKLMYSSKAKKNQFIKSDVQLVSERDDRINSFPSLSNDENLYWVHVQLYTSGCDSEGSELKKTQWKIVWQTRTDHIWL